MESSKKYICTICQEEVTFEECSLDEFGGDCICNECIKAFGFADADMFWDRTEDEEWEWEWEREDDCDVVECDCEDEECCNNGEHQCHK